MARKTPAGDPSSEMNQSSSESCAELTVSRSASYELDHAEQAPWMADRLISVREIRMLFRLGRTAAYELTHRSGFPEPVVISSRCYRWWASEVIAFAACSRREARQPRHPGNGSHASAREISHASTSPPHISGKVRIARTRRKAS
jgi:predicted DNA-binding transcriptional regulator AlpA